MGIRVLERVDTHGRCGGHLRRAAGGQLQQRLCGFTRQVAEEVEDGVLIGGMDIGQPLHGHPVAQQLVVRQASERLRLGRRLLRLWHVDGNGDLLDGLPHLDQLRSAGSRVGLQLPALGPPVGIVVVVNVAEHEAVLRLVNDDPDVEVDPDRPEVGVPRAIEPVQLEARARWVDLQIERRGFDGLLLIAGQPRKAGRERIGDRS